MNEKNTKLYLFVVITYWIAAMEGQMYSEASIDDDFMTLEDKMKEQDRIKWSKVRCTRRFTPGVCVESVIRVWTFDYHIQNCTERLGCPSSRRTNRFGNYQACIRRCQTLIDLYMQILEYQGRRNTHHLSGEVSGIAARREGSHIHSSTSSPDDYEEESSGDEVVNAQWIYGDDTSQEGFNDESIKPAGDHFYLH